MAALGAAKNVDAAPDLGWLPRENPLRHNPFLSDAVKRGHMSVLFWIEPFELPDVWTVWPGTVVVSVADSAVMFENFKRFAEDVAARASALSDPTRLAILRLIRQAETPNTTIAAYLGLSRPTVSVHAKILREAGFIRSRKEGRIVRHDVVPGNLEALFHDLDRLLDLPKSDPDEG